MFRIYLAFFVLLLFCFSPFCVLGPMFPVSLVFSYVFLLFSLTFSYFALDIMLDRVLFKACRYTLKRIINWY